MTPPSKTYQLVNTTNGTTIAGCTRLADNPWTSFKGLMGAAPLPAGAALLITPSSSIHTHFMRFAIEFFMSIKTTPSWASTGT